MQHINQTSYLMKTLTRKTEYLNMHTYSKVQYRLYINYPVSDPPSKEDKQRLHYLEILKEMNDSMQEHAKKLRDDGSNLNLKDRKLSIIDPKVKKFMGNNRNEKQIISKVENSSNDNLKTKKKRVGGVSKFKYKKTVAPIVENKHYSCSNLLKGINLETGIGRSVILII
jgi:hypothetical protein